MKVIAFLAFLLFIIPVYGQNVIEDEKQGSLSAEEMREIVSKIKKEVNKIEINVEKLKADAIAEKDIKWKLCVDDILATVKGLVASIASASSRMSDLIKADKQDAAYSQFILIKGLKNSVDRSFSEVQACGRQVTKIDAESTITKTENKETTGTYEGDGTISESMGVGFSEDFSTEKDQGTIEGSNIGDTAASDSYAGPVGTPANQDEESESVADNLDFVSNPPTKPVSPVTNMMD